MASNCFICNSLSIQKEIDHGNRLFVKCEASDCGDYEISIQAIQRISEHLYAKENFQPLVNKCRKAGKIAEIIMEDNKLVFIDMD